MAKIGTGLKRLLLGGMLLGGLAALPASPAAAHASGYCGSGASDVSGNVIDGYWFDQYTGQYTSGSSIYYNYDHYYASQANANFTKQYADSRYCGNIPPYGRPQQ